MTDTKTITFEGRSYTVPVWVEWVARDEDGSIYAFETEPSIYAGVFNNAKSVFIGTHYSGWADSLTKV